VTEPLQGSDWNAVDFGDDCVINGFLQFHTFENMTLKVKRTRIGDGCVVPFGATVMSGANIEQKTTLMPLSMVLKEMHVPTGMYEGSPAEPASGPDRLPPLLYKDDEAYFSIAAPIKQENRVEELAVVDNAKR
jgi:carbonic anhydrase/acetyltransferase-like protein (isoleucine patch superfamily)